MLNVRAIINSGSSGFRVSPKRYGETIRMGSFPRDKARSALPTAALHRVGWIRRVAAIRQHHGGLLREPTRLSPLVARVEQSETRERVSTKIKFFPRYALLHAGYR